MNPRRTTVGRSAGSRRVRSHGGLRATTPALGGHPTGHGVLLEGKCAPPAQRENEARATGDRPKTAPSFSLAPQRGRDWILNPLVRALGLHPFTPERFHVLLNSLFKVLFNFPSRYLFTIGLVVVFSLRWSLPPVLGLHSQATRLTGEVFSEAATVPQAWHPLGTVTPFKRDLDRPRHTERFDPPIRYISRRHCSTGGFSAGLFPFRSPLLGESLLVSFPPLTNMLKFSG